MDIGKVKKIHIIGIEGCGTSALARLFLNMGKVVSGSDEGDHFYYDAIKDLDIKVFHKFDPDNISSDTDLIIYSIAFTKENNSELKKAFESKIKTITYGEALSMVFNSKYGISVAGSHGKTTTSAWLAFVLEQANFSPSAVIGAKVPQFNNKGSIVGKSDYFVLESDEYGNKLAYLNPKMALLNNIEYDHPDIFPTQEDYNKVFIDFIQKIPKKGILIANFDNRLNKKFAHVNCRGKVISYAINDSADYVAYDIKQENGKMWFKVKLGVEDSMFEDDEEDISLDNNELGDFCIQLLGIHNVYNAMAVIIACIELGMDLVDLRTYLAEFKGTSRRMELMGEFRGAKIIDDYAHHPTEIKTTLKAVRSGHKDNNIITVFHPHTFSRTKSLLNEFADSFDDSDEVIILDIYPSREKKATIHSEELVDKIVDTTENKNLKVKYLPKLDDVESYLRENIGRGDVVVLMGAGDVYKIGKNILDL